MGVSQLGLILDINRNRFAHISLFMRMYIRKIPDRSQQVIKLVQNNNGKTVTDVWMTSSMTS